MRDAWDVLPKSREAAIQMYTDRLTVAEAKGNALRVAAERWLAQNDLFFLMVYVLKRRDLNRDWLFARCREVQHEPNGYLDIWSREHYKSSLITVGLTIQDILNHPSITVGIFSHTRPVAKSFLGQIKREFEANDDLKRLFPDILYGDPHHQSPKWSLDDGIIVQRKDNPKESTVEAWGLVDGQPTGKHFKLLVYDDVVTTASVTTPEMIQKTTEAWAMSLNLGAEGGARRIIGTRYHHADTYYEMLERGSAKPRFYPATEDGTFDGNPVLWTRETLRQKRIDMGPWVAACFPAGAPVLMADWTEKAISAIRPGDEVIGWFMKPHIKTRLVKTKVLAVQERVGDVAEYKMGSGLVVRCTPDHKWYTGRRSTDWHNIYVPLGMKRHYHRAKALVRVIQSVPTCPDPIAAAYLAGIFDGEGSASAARLAITQDERVNPGVCQKIRWALGRLGFQWAEQRPSGRPTIRHFVLYGGRQETLRFLRWCQPAKTPAIVDMLFRHGHLFGGKDYNKEAVVEWPTETHRETVWNIETETGNFIAYGYATKNSQLLCNPTADQAQGFLKEWLQYWDARNVQGLNLYILCDPAQSKKARADYTSMFVVGLGEDDVFRIVDMIRDRLNLTERADRLFAWHRQYRPLGVAYEEYGLQADIEHFRDRMRRENYRFHVSPVGGKMKKEERIRRLIPLFEQGRVLLPENCWHRNAEGTNEDLTRVFVNQEYLPFPVSHHDDMLDALARLVDLRTDRPQRRESVGGPTQTRTAMRRLRR